VILSCQLPDGDSPQLWTDMKVQFLKPADDLSLGRSDNSTVLVSTVERIAGVIIWALTLNKSAVLLYH